MTGRFSFAPGSIAKALQSSPGTPATPAGAGSVPAPSKTPTATSDLKESGSTPAFTTIGQNDLPNDYFQGHGYGPSNLKDVSGRPLLWYENQKTQSSELLTDRTDEPFDFTKPQKLTSDMMGNPRMSQDISDGIRNKWGAQANQELDHIIPRSLGGSNELANLRLETTQNPSESYNIKTNPTPTDPFEYATWKKAVNGEISVQSAIEQVAARKGLKLPENAGMESYQQQANQPPPKSVLGANRFTKEDYQQAAMQFFPETTKAIADLQIDPLSLNTSPSKFISDVWDSIAKPIEQEAGNIKDLISGAVETTKAGIRGDLAGQQEGQNKVLVSGLRGIGGAGAIAFSPISAFFSAVNDIPVLGTASKLLFNVPFSILGDGGADVGKAIVDKIPMPADVKPQVRDAVGQVFALAAQIYVGGKLIEGVKELTPSERGAAAFRAEVSRENPEIADQVQKMPTKNINKAVKDFGKEAAKSMAIKAAEMAKEKSQSPIPSPTEGVSPIAKNQGKVIPAAGEGSGALPAEPRIPIKPPLSTQGGFIDPIGAIEGVKENINDASSYIQESRRQVRLGNDVSDNYYRLIENGKKMDDIFSRRLLQVAEVSPEEQANIYGWIEDKNSPITDIERAKYERYVKPLIEASNEMWAHIKNRDIPINKNDFTTRVAENKGSLLDRMVRGFKNTLSSNKLRKTAGFFKARVMMALEDENGNRRVVSIKKGEVTAWDNGDPTSMGSFDFKTYRRIMNEELSPLQKKMDKLQTEKDILSKTKGRATSAQTRLENVQLEMIRLTNQMADIENKYSTTEGKAFTDSAGKQWKVTQATTKEIEANTDIRYYKTPLVNELNRYNKLNQIMRATQFLESTKSALESEGIIKKMGSPDIPESWRMSDLPHFRGYLMPNHMANILDVIYRKYGTSEPAGLMTKVNGFLRTTIFFNPLIHVPNIAVHWIANRGTWRWASPVDYVRMTTAGIKAIRATLTMNDDYQDALQSGAPLLYSETVNKGLYQLFMQKAGLELQANDSFMGVMAQAFDLPIEAIKKSVGGIYNFSGRVTWAVNDIATLQSIYEEMGRGKTWDNAIADVGKHIPNYRMPADILGNKQVMDAIKNPNLTMFSSYHYGALRSYFEMAKSIVNVSKPAEMFDALDKVIMLGIVTFVIYPQLDQLAKKITGNKNARFRRAGAATFIANTQQLASGQKDFVSYLESVITPSVALQVPIGMGQGFIQLPSRTEFEVNPLGSAESTAATIAAQTVSPLGYASNIIKGKKTWQQTLFGFMGISTSETTPNMSKAYNLIYNQRASIEKEAKQLMDAGNADEAQKLIVQYDRDLFSAYVGVFTDRGDSQEIAAQKVAALIRDPQSKIISQFISGISQKQMENYKAKQGRTKLQNLIMK